MKSFPGMCPVQIRRDNIQAAREYIQQNRMITVTIVAISPEMVGNMGPQMDKVGHPMAPGNVPGFQLLLQGLFSLSAVREYPCTLSSERAGSQSLARDSSRLPVSRTAEGRCFCQTTTDAR